MTLPIDSNKFELNERVYPVLQLNGRYFVNPPFTIGYNQRVGNEWYYSFTTEYGFPENDLFRSKLEALAECERRNR